LPPRWSLVEVEEVKDGDQLAAEGEQPAGQSTRRPGAHDHAEVAANCSK
jgi:hypothetical protein